VLGLDVLAKSQAVTIAGEEATSELTLQVILACPDHCEGSDLVYDDTGLDLVMIRPARRFDSSRCEWRCRLQLSAFGNWFK
jgi:hypothetical protein